MEPVANIPGTLASPDTRAYLQRQIADLLKIHSTAFPGCQPVSFSRSHIKNLLEQDFYVCEKSDGIRCLMYITLEPNVKTESVFLINRKNEYYHVDNLHFPRADDIQKCHPQTLIDGELVISSKPDGTKELQYLVFDCLAFHGLLLASRILDTRLGYLKENFYLPYKALLEKYPEEKEYAPFTVHFKQMELSYALPSLFEKIIPRLQHVSDGLIFTSRMAPYVFRTDEMILKWKPPDQNSVDFLLGLEFPVYTDPEDSNETYIDYDSKPGFILKTWLGENKYDVVDEMFVTDEEWEKFKALNEPLQDRVVECFKDNNKLWRYMRFRDDKDNGNHVGTYHKVLASIEDGVTKEELIQKCPQIRESWKRREELKRQEAKRRDQEANHGGNPQSDHKRSASEADRQPKRQKSQGSPY